MPTASLDRRMSTQYAKLLVIFGLLALVPVLPYFLFGYRGQDYSFHLHSWFDLRLAWQAGSYFPGWATHANYTLGDPRFLYYPPVSFLVGAALSVCLPAQLVPAAFVWITGLLAGWCMYVGSRPFVRQQDRVFAALLYVLSPYFLATSLSRFAAAELLVQSWLPLVFLAFYRSIWLEERRAVVWLGALLGLCWLTNVPESIVLFYTLLLGAAVVMFRRRSLRALLSFVAAETIAAGVAAFYLLPVLAEKGLINSDAVLRFGYRQWLILARSAQPHPSLQITCWLTACVSFVVVISCAWISRSSRSGGRATYALLDLSLIAFLFQLPVAVFLWEFLPELRFVEFAFRFIPVLGWAVPLMLLQTRSSKFLRISSYALLGLLAVRPFWHYVRAASHDEQGKVHLSPLAGAQLSHTEESDGWMGIDEYIPAGASMPASFSSVPEIAPVGHGDGGQCAAVMESRSPDRLFFKADSDAGCRVRLPLFDYPYWSAVDGDGHPLRIEDDGGLATVTVPPGDQHVELIFRARSAYRTLGKIISVLFAVLVFVILRVIRRGKNDERREGQIGVRRAGGAIAGPGYSTTMD